MERSGPARRRSRLAGLAVALVLVGGLTIACARAESGSGQPAAGRFAPPGSTYLVADVTESVSTPPTRTTLAAVALVIGADLDDLVPDYETRLRPKRVEFAVPPDAEVPDTVDLVALGYDPSSDGFVELRPVTDAVAASAGSCPPDAATAPPDGVLRCDADATELFTLEPSLLQSYSTVASASASPASVGTGWVVTVEFHDNDAATLAAWSVEHAGQRLAILHKDVVVAAPTVETELSGPVQIAGNFTEEEATLLAAYLHIGAVGATWAVNSSGENPGD